MIQEIVALIIVAAAVLYLVERMFGVLARLGVRRAAKQPKVQLGSRLQRGLKKSARDA